MFNFSSDANSANEEEKLMKTPEVNLWLPDGFVHMCASISPHACAKAHGSMHVHDTYAYKLRK